MKDTTIYIRTKGTKTWRKFDDFPTTREEAEQVKQRIEARGKSEVKLAKASKGRLFNY